MSFEHSPIKPNERHEKQARYFPLREIVTRDQIGLLEKYIDKKKLPKILDRRLKTPEVREAFLERFLSLVEDGLNTGNHEEVVAGLTGIGAGVMSLLAVEEGEPPPEFLGGVVFDEPTEKYIALLGNGTGGKRLLIRRDFGRDTFERFIFFPSQGKTYSEEYQQAFRALFGARVMNTAPEGHDSDLLVLIGNGSLEDRCPCGNGRKLKECHGA